MQSVEKTFQLSRYDRELLQRTEYDLQVNFFLFLKFIDLIAIFQDINESTYLKVLIIVLSCALLQVWCMLLNDKVQFRMHWPQHAELQVNGI